MFLDIEPLAPLRNLHLLHLSGNEIAEIEPLFGLPGVTHLRLSDNKIVDIAPLSSMTGLQELELGGNSISNVSPLAEMKYLRTLDLAENSIIEIEPLSALTKLTLLKLSSNSIVDVAPLATLTTLDDLYLSGNSILDISPLASLTDLYRLEIGANSISNIEPLSAMAELQWLDLFDNSIEDSSPLEDLSYLQFLSLYGNQVEDISPLVTTVGSYWRQIDARQPKVYLTCCPSTGYDGANAMTNPLSDESVLIHLPALRSRGVVVYFGSESFSEVDIPDENLRRLIELELGKERGAALTLADMAALTNIVPDQEERDLLSLGDIVDLSGLQFAINLIELDLSNHAIEDIEALAELTNLTEVNLSGNAITDIGPLGELTNLARLDVSNNLIVDIETLSELTNLEELNLSNNSISDIGPLLDLTNLKGVNVGGNPLGDESLDTHLAALRTRGVRAYWISSASEVRNVVSMFPAASDPLREGFVRIINHSDWGSEVYIHPTDDGGRRYDPLRLFLGDNRVAHFNSNDLELGNPGKGLSGGTGPVEENWRLEFRSALDIEVLSYIRTRDGFVTTMHDVAPRRVNRYRVDLFNPASNVTQVSHLRLINPGEESAAVVIEGIDDHGNTPGNPVTLSLPGGTAHQITAKELEFGSTSLDGALRDGAGKWRLSVESDQSIVVMNLLESPTGHLANLSTAPEPLKNGLHRVPLFPSAADANGLEGFVRVINRDDAAGEVRISAFDDTQWEYEPVLLSIGPRQSVHFNSHDLESGNAKKGLSGSTGAGEGDWWLELSSELNIEVRAYIRTRDGFVTAMHDLAPRDRSVYRVVTFNPGRNRSQVSRLRLINPGMDTAEIRIWGYDDERDSDGNWVEFPVPARSARSLTATDLEAGREGLQGALGIGKGKWRLEVESDQPVDVISLLESPTGHLTNLSTARVRGPVHQVALPPDMALGN